MKRLTLPANRPQNDRTTTVIGHRTRQNCGFFMLGFRHQGLLTQGNETGTRQIAKFGARITPGNKGSNPTNNRGRITAVVEPLRLPFRDALQSILIRSNYLMQHNTQTPNTGDNYPNPAQTTAKATTGLGSVRFDHSPFGAVDLDGTTVLSRLLNLGAMAKATKIPGQETFNPHVATDSMGRKLLADQLHCGIEEILEGISVINRLLAKSHGDLEQWDITQAAWLTCGLADLAKDMAHERCNILFEMKESLEGQQNLNGCDAPASDEAQACTDS